MLSIYDAASAATAFAQPINPSLRETLQSKLEQAKSAGLEDLTHLLVIQPGDSEKSIMEEIGFSPLYNLIDEIRFGEPDFQPYWAWLHDSQDWYQLIVTVGNGGFAYLVFILKADGVLPDLLAMGEAFAVPATVGEQQP